jgi:hypothetical protein
MIGWSRTPAQEPGAVRRPGFFKNLFYWVMDWDDEATLEEGLRRMRSAPGYFASLPPETLEHLRAVGRRNTVRN